MYAARLNFRNTRVGGNLHLYDFLIGEYFLGTQTNVLGNAQLWFRNLGYEPADFRNLTVGGDLMLVGKPAVEGARAGPLPTIDLGGAKIDGDLRVGSRLKLTDAEEKKIQMDPEEPMRDIVAWRPNAVLKLNHASMRGISDVTTDCENAELGSRWPIELALDGVVFQKLKPTDTTDYGAIACWLALLRRQERPTSSQPFRQLAAVLRTYGQEDHADEVLYESKNQELLETKSRTRRILLFLSWGVIGYGYKLYFALIPCVVLLFLGRLVLFMTRRDRILQYRLCIYI
jgi:hypothetical protein